LDLAVPELVHRLGIENVEFSENGNFQKFFFFFEKSDPDSGNRENPEKPGFWVVDTLSKK
jgi:hypothetical protein